MITAARQVEIEWEAARGTNDEKTLAEIGAKIRMARKMLTKREYSQFKLSCGIKPTSYSKLLNTFHPEVEEL
ncbi:hypothetical protein VPHK225_0047 [Vibrio phage K225]|nr:hypothetical protein PODOV044v1_p0042 [Vibrio phage 23E28.1]QZI92048.1 hypothetical protein PODOV045v1_p0006 [Vibrio phage 69E27.1]